MAKPSQVYPSSATHGDRAETPDEEGRAELERALAEHGDELAALVRSSDELDEALTTAILVAASADEDDVAHITDSASNLVEAADGLSTEGSAALATELGANADELVDALEMVVELQRQGHLDDLATVATAVTDSLSPSEVQRLATMLEDEGADFIDTLDVVLELQREGDLEALVDTAQTLSALELDADAVAGMNSLVGALGQAQRETEPMGVLGAISALRSADARAALGYLVTFLRALGQRVRGR